MNGGTPRGSSAQRCRQPRRSVQAVLGTAMVLLAAACSASEPAAVEPTTPPSSVAEVERSSGALVTIPVATLAPPEPRIAGQAQWTEDFTGDTGLERLRTGVYHRDDNIVTETSWLADHDLDCGPPSTSRTIHRVAPSESIYLCRDHLMTAVGDTAPYSVAWFSPAQSFDDLDEVCWSATLNDLGSRKWWKVAVLSVDAPDVMSEVAAADLTGIVGPDRAVASWGGVGGYLGKVRIGDERMDWWYVSAGSDRATRYPACFRDNGDDTLTFEITGPMNGTDRVETDSFTVAGAFPEGPKKVVFQDHSYTPSKSDNGVGGTPVSYTIHWDDIVIN